MLLDADTLATNSALSDNFDFLADFFRFQYAVHHAASGKGETGICQEPASSHSVALDVFVHASRAFKWKWKATRNAP